MGKGKACAQIAHASLESYKRALEKNKALVRKWEGSGAKKVVVKASLEELLSIMEKAKALSIPFALIRDAGLTQLKEGEITALALGPWKEEEIDKLTSHLKLY